MLSESQLKNIVNGMINEGGKRGKYKEVWNDDDQTLAMYNALYGIEELGVTKEEVANKVIGSSLSAFVQQSLNFEFLAGMRSSYDREHKLQPKIYQKFKGFSHKDFKEICSYIIEKRLDNPEDSVIKMELGKKIGDKRDEITRGREEGLRKQGANPNNFKFLRGRVINYNDDPETDTDTMSNDVPEKNVLSQKNDIQQHIEKMYKIAMNMKSSGNLNGIDELLSNLEFLDEYSGLEESRIRKSIRKNLRNL